MTAYFLLEILWKETQNITIKITTFWKKTALKAFGLLEKVKADFYLESSLSKCFSYCIQADKICAQLAYPLGYAICLRKSFLLVVKI